MIRLGGASRHCRVLLNWSLSCSFNGTKFPTAVLTHLWTVSTLSALH